MKILCIMCARPTRGRTFRNSEGKTSSSEFCSTRCEAHAGRVWAHQYTYCRDCGAWTLFGDACNCPEDVTEKD